MVRSFLSCTSQCIQTGYETDRGTEAQLFLFAMDPLTAFSLACGVIQVVDFSLNVVGKCREVYRDGTSTEHLGQVSLIMLEIESLCVIQIVYDVFRDWRGFGDLYWGEGQRRVS